MCMFALLSTKPEFDVRLYTWKVMEEYPFPDDKTGKRVLRSTVLSSKHKGGFVVGKTYHRETSSPVLVVGGGLSLYDATRNMPRLKYPVGFHSYVAQIEAVDRLHFEQKSMPGYDFVLVSVVVEGRLAVGIGDGMGITKPIREGMHDPYYPTVVVTERMTPKTVYRMTNEQIEADPWIAEGGSLDVTSEFLSTDDEEDHND
jgi:hypothetical protein